MQDGSSTLTVLIFLGVICDPQIQQMASRLSRSQEDAMRRKSQELGQRTEEQKEQLRRGGVNALRGKDHSQSMVS